MLVVSGAFLYYSNFQRVSAGYFDDAIWITIRDISWVIFFGLFVGLVLNVIVKKANGK